MEKLPAKQLSLSDPALLVLLGAGVALFHILTNGQYGFHRDELDILMNARQLAWGYVAYPPLTPFLARLGLMVFGPSLVGLRAWAALAQGLVAVLVGLMARDFGGKRWAQVTAVIAVAISPLALTTGMLIQYMSFDYLWWVVLAFFTVRLLRTDDPRWWLGIGTAIGLGMMTKYTLMFFVAGLVVGTVLTPARRFLRSRWLWAGLAVSLLILLPNLIWQVQHHFITISFLSSIHARDIQWGRTASYLPDQLYLTTNPLTLPLWVIGLVYCAVAPSGKQFRLLAWMFFTAFLLFLVTSGRSYYLAPAYPMLMAVGAVWLESRLASLSHTGMLLSRSTLALMLGVGGVAGVLLAKPVSPIHSPVWKVATGISDVFVEMVGWPDLAQEVSKVYEGIPDAEKPSTGILAGNYGEAGALDLYGPALGLPKVISGGNSLWERGYGDPAPKTVIVVGFERAFADRLFSACQLAGTVSNADHVNNEETQYHSQLFVCRQPRHPWAEMWPTMQWFQ
jgi:4-amino-4-deoxy-L-arabinose transferase-like glycosyltransferase